MKPLDRWSIDTATGNISLRKGGGMSLRRVAATAFAAVALVGAETADAGIVTLPVWVDSISVKGNISWPTSTGGIGEYIFTDNQGNTLFTGTGVLWAPTAGNPYQVSFEAMYEWTDTKFDMLVEFPNLIFTSAYSFEAGSLNMSNGLNSLSSSNYTVGSWDNSWFGDISMRGNAHISAVPEPSTFALGALGLGVVGLAARRRRSATTGASPEIKKTETPEETAA